MDSDTILQDASLEDLLEAGNQALAAGKRRAAHNIWRSAAVANPYDERVWVSLLQVLSHDDDRRVCLENIVAINPLNTDARRQLRLLRREERLQEETSQPVAPAIKAANIDFSIEPLPRSNTRTSHVPPKQRSLLWALAAGVGIGLLAVLLGIFVSVMVYGGVITAAVP